MRPDTAADVDPCACSSSEITAMVSRESANRWTELMADTALKIPNRGLLSIGRSANSFSRASSATLSVDRGVIIRETLE
jgi:hypothetical protein